MPDPVEVHIQYACGCGFKTHDLEEAKLHVILKGHILVCITGSIRPESQVVPQGTRE